MKREFIRPEDTLVASNMQRLNEAAAAAAARAAAYGKSTIQLEPACASYWISLVTIGSHGEHLTNRFRLTSLADVKSVMAQCAMSNSCHECIVSENSRVIYEFHNFHIL